MHPSSSPRNYSAIIRAALIINAVILIGGAVVLFVSGHNAAAFLNDTRFGTPALIAALPLLMLGVLPIYTAFTRPLRTRFAWAVGLIDVGIAVSCVGLVLVAPDMRAPSILAPLVGGAVVCGALAGVIIYGLRGLARADR